MLLHNFLGRLVGYDRELITPAQAAKVQPFLDSPDFDPDSIRRVSTACARLCQFRSLIKYYRVRVQLMALKRRLEEVERRLAELKNPSVAEANEESC